MTHDIVIIGGGYAGTTAANRLASSAAGRHGDLTVTLVNPRDRFVERIRLHEYAASSREDPTVPYASLLNSRVRLVRAQACAIDAPRRTVSLGGGDVLAYDYLVYAPGSGAGSAPHGAHRIDTVEGAAGLRAALADGRWNGCPRVAVVGGGLTAIEVATELAEQHPESRVSIHAVRMAPSLSSAGRAHVTATLDRLDVRVREGAVVRPDAGTDIRAALDADIVVWCAGFEVPRLAAASDLPVDAHGRLLVTSTLHSISDARVLGAGDAAHLDDARYDYLRMACATAMPQGGRAADNILRAIEGREAIPHSNGFLAQCVSLGRRDAVVQFTHLDDRPTPFVWRGPLGAWAKETICRLTISWLRGESRRSGSYRWVPRRLPAAAVDREIVAS